MPYYGDSTMKPIAQPNANVAPVARCGGRFYQPPSQLIMNPRCL